MSKAVEVIRLVLLICFITEIAQGEVVYFLVGEIHPSHNDCYVLPLSNPADIAHARDLIGGYGPGIENAIVVATITRLPPGSYSINRNYLVPGLPGWSWQVSFVRFVPATIEILDGWPTWVEQDPLSWPSGSRIGFWAYTVKAELGTDLEPWNCDLNIDGNINFSDFSMVASNWGESILGGSDINGSGKVDIYDLAVLADNWLGCLPSRH